MLLHVIPLTVLLLVVPAVGAQTKQIDDDVKQRLETLKFVAGLRDADTGAFKPKPDAAPGLRATSSAVRTWKYLGGDRLSGPLPDRDKTAAFVMKCYDPDTGGFADTPGGKPDVFLTAVGVMAAVELGIPKEKFAKAMDYLKANARTFEDVRIGAAAVEAWGVKDCPFDLKPWLAIADQQLGPDGTAGEGKGVPRATASVIAMKLRLGQTERDLRNENKLDDIFQRGQWDDGGYGEAGATGSDLGSTYRVMRAYVLMRERPKERDAMRAFIRRCRNADGGYGVKPGAPSDMSGTYYAAIITKWLDAMEGK